MTNIDNSKKTINIYCFLGLPGCGKGTQIDIFSKSLDATVVSMGNEIRKELETADLNDPFYLEIKRLYDQGIPQPDNVAIDIVKKRLTSSFGNIIFDNFPFSKNQANLFFDICEELGVNYPKLIIINITPEESIHRVVYRKVCADCGHITADMGENICDKCGGAMISRADDNEDTVKERIKNYLPRISEVKSFFEAKGLVYEIDGSGSIEEVTQLILGKIK